MKILKTLIDDTLKGECSYYKQRARGTHQGEQTDWFPSRCLVRGAASSWRCTQVTRFGIQRPWFDVVQQKDMINSAANKKQAVAMKDIDIIDWGASFPPSARDEWIRPSWFKLESTSSKCLQLTIIEFTLIVYMRGSSKTGMGGHTCSGSKDCRSQH